MNSIITQKKEFPSTSSVSNVIKMYAINCDASANTDSTIAVDLITNQCLNPVATDYLGLALITTVSSMISDVNPESFRSIMIHYFSPKLPTAIFPFSSKHSNSKETFMEQHLLMSK